MATRKYFPQNTKVVPVEELKGTSVHFMNYEEAFEEYCLWADKHKTSEGIIESNDPEFPYYFEIIY